MGGGRGEVREDLRTGPMLVSTFVPSPPSRPVTEGHHLFRAGCQRLCVRSSVIGEENLTFLFRHLRKRRGTISPGYTARVLIWFFVCKERPSTSRVGETRRLTTRVKLKDFVVLSWKESPVHRVGTGSPKPLPVNSSTHKPFVEMQDRTRGSKEDVCSLRL